MLGRYIRNGELSEDNAVGALPEPVEKFLDRRMAKTVEKGVDFASDRTVA
jgi:hypothetical protein